MGYIEALNKAREAELCIRADMEHIERLHRIMRTPCKSQRYAESIVYRLVNLEAELNREIDRAVDIKREALCILSSLEGSERAVLYRYYILGESWKEVSKKMYISERQTYYYRKAALKRIDEKYSKNRRELWNSEKELRN